MSLYAYGNTFFEYQQAGSLTSARAVVPLVLRHLKPRSVLDVGCGAGAWVRSYLEAGVVDVAGVDAPYVRRDQLLFPASRFTPVDVGQAFDLGRRFDVAQCLEVAEHLDAQAGETLAANLVAHSDLVVFSAARPGQGGEHHVNERPYDYWRDLFEQRGFAFFDFLRPRLLARADVEPWYRYNMMLFVHGDAMHALPPVVLQTRWPAGQPVPDLAPLAWRLRCHALSRLPVRAVSMMAGAKHRLHLMKHPGVHA
jgi:SAM-dependent methyltransferase